jgi:6-phosphogluconolactonase (cycloisomerase 2 family)
MNARIVLTLAFALIAGCGGGGGDGGGKPEVPTGFLYVTAVAGPNALLSDIYGLATHTSGRLSLVPGSPAGAQDGGGGPIAISHDSKLLFTPNIYALMAFQINADGSLTLAPSSGLSVPDGIDGLVSHPTADFLYAFSVSGVLSVYTVNSATGALNLTSSVSFPNEAGLDVASSAVITPNGRYLYQNAVYYTQFNGQFPTALRIAGFSIDSATGGLSPVPGSPVSPPVPSTIEGSELIIDPGGKFLYAGYNFAILNVGDDGAIAAFSIDPTSGALTAVPGSPFSVGGVPQSLAIDASGKYLIVSLLGGGAANCLAVLAIDPDTGALTPVPGSPFGPLQSCGSVVADPSGPFVYAGTLGTGAAHVFAFSIDPATGALTPIMNTGFPDSTKINTTSMAVTH